MRICLATNRSSSEGPYKVLKRHNDTMTIIINGKETTVSIESVKEAKLPVPTKETGLPQLPTDEKAEVSNQRPKRTIKFNQNNDYFYY